MARARGNGFESKFLSLASLEKICASRSVHCTSPTGGAGFCLCRIAFAKHERPRLDAEKSCELGRFKSHISQLSGIRGTFVNRIVRRWVPTEFQGSAFSFFGSSGCFGFRNGHVGYADMDSGEVL